jgi:hypothetical protein
MFTSCLVQFFSKKEYEKQIHLVCSGGVVPKLSHNYMCTTATEHDQYFGKDGCLADVMRCTVCLVLEL